MTKQHLQRLKVRLHYLIFYSKVKTFWSTSYLQFPDRFNILQALKFFTTQKSLILKIITASISLFQSQVATLLQVKSCHADASQIQRLTHALVQKEGEIKILNAKISTLEKERVWNQNDLLKLSSKRNCSKERAASATSLFFLI